MLKTIGAAVAIAVPLLALAAPAEAAARPGWLCDFDGGGDSGMTGVGCENSSGVIGIAYYDDGDVLRVTDRHGTSTKSAIGYLEVAGSGTSVFTGGTSEHHLSFTEGKKVRVKVCTSGGSDKFCSPWSRYGRT
ncbi:MAG: hypothetical protein HOY71_55830 [Nonomuraea sp.]|nr:hypothetical protein [Nonomuraea sp.]